MKTFIRILGFAKPIGRYMIPYMILSILSIIFSVLNYSTLIPVLNLFFGEGANNAVVPAKLPEFSYSMNYLKDVFDYYVGHARVEHGIFGALVGVCLLIIVSSLLTNAFKYAGTRLVNRMRTDVVRNIRKAIYEKILSLHIGFFTNERKGDLMSRLTNDVQEIEYSVLSTAVIFFRDPFQVIIWFAMLLLISWKLTLVSLIILPTMGGVIAFISKKLKKQSQQSQETLGSILSIIDESIGGLRVIKAFNAKDFIYEKFRKENDEYGKILKVSSHRRELASPLAEFLGVIIVCVIVLVGGSMVLSKELDPKLFLFFIVAFWNLSVPIKSITGSISQIQRAIVCGERIFAIIDTENPIKEKAGAKELKSFEHSITFDNVTFAYDREPVLLNIKLDLTKGKTIALVGPSGGGKSTLADLIPRFYDPAEGRVMIDGVDIKEYSLDSLRSHMGIVTQESILFNDSIYNNIAFGMEHVKLDDVIRAAKIANAHDFIMQTEHGYDTSIGDRGMKLSGGQRQRLSIARAVLKNPPVLILDEATSALDNESERLVQDALNKLMKDRTSIVIAHRLTTVQHADEIIVLGKGEIVERGTHQELIKLRGTYAKLYENAGEQGLQ